MEQIGKIFNKVPYIVRDEQNNYKDLKFLEEILNEFIISDSFKQSNIINVFSNNRDNLLHFHLLINKDIEKEHIDINYKDMHIEFTLEVYKEAKTKTKNTNSFMFMESFKHLNEENLISIFDDFIGCNGKNLFISIPKEKQKLFLPSSKHYNYRKILLEKKHIIENISESYNVDCTGLYCELNPNIIKQTCKDLNLTYKKISYELGYKPDTINKAASTGKISDQLNRAIELYLENLRLKEELKDFDTIKTTLKNVMI